jgi:hypothetical protein
MANIKQSHRKDTDVLVGWGAEKERFPLSREERKLVVERGRKRLYLPLKLQTSVQIDQMVQEATALVCLFLAQKQLVSLDSNKIVRNFLLSYVAKCKGAEDVDITRVLEKILRSYQFPEDYRAFRKYVETTIWRELTPQRRRACRSFSLDSARSADLLVITAAADHEESENVRKIRSCSRSEHARRGESTYNNAVFVVAERLEVSERWLYTLAKQEKVRTDKNPYLILPSHEVERLEREQAERRLRKMLIKARQIKVQQAKPNSLIASARRWVERQEKQGLGIKEIIQKIGRMWIEKAIHFRAEEAEDGKINNLK